MAKEHLERIIRKLNNVEKELYEAAVEADRAGDKQGAKELEGDADRINKRGQQFRQKGER
jgi:division protein CdvB (Snf7/Vps24/ESCRT-III family)